MEKVKWEQELKEMKKQEELANKAEEEVKILLKERDEAKEARLMEKEKQRQDLIDQNE